MASSSQSSNFVINFHRGGSFVRNPLTYDFEILVKVENVDLSSMDYDALGRLILSEFSSEVKSMFYLLPGKDLDSGLSSMFELNEADGSDSDLEDDLFDYFSEDNSDTTFVDHLYDGKEEVFEIRTQKAAPKPRQKPSKMFDITFLTRIYSALDMEEYVDTDVRPLAEDHDIVGDQFPIHDPSIKWKLIKPVLGSTCKLGVDNMPDGKNYFKTFYVCFTGVTQGWLQGCMRVIGLDGCFLKTICKGELLSVVGGDGNNQIYPIAWAVIDVENKENWSWFMKCLIDDLGIDVGACLTVISYHHKEWITDKACDVVKNGISECFNALIVEARRKPIIDMLEGIRLMIMERMRKMREKHVKGDHGIYPNIKKKFEIIKDFHMNWKVVPSGESKFEGYNLRSFPTKAVGEGYASGQTKSVSGGKTARGGSSVRGGKTARGGNASGSASGRGIKTRGGASSSASGSAQGYASREGSACGRGWGRGWSTLAQVFKKVNGRAVRQRGRGDGSKSSAYPHGIPVPAWPYDGIPDDLLGADEIPLTNTQPMADEPSPTVPASPSVSTSQNVPTAPNVPAPNVLAPNIPTPNVPTPIMRKESERIKQIKFNKPLSLRQ
ncbi:(R)-mandelonitrile lyase-like protein [Tanacetum coccineum]|uniref:(R)-mandelonitrile lyase-like protein n=1 Tax=Tanacetum coccineum TaxID=301880 RepID=A0ABQ5IWS0_9ASTR